MHTHTSDQFDTLYISYLRKMQSKFILNQDIAMTTEHLIGQARRKVLINSIPDSSTKKQH